MQQKQQHCCRRLLIEWRQSILHRLCCYRFVAAAVSSVFYCLRLSLTLSSVFYCLYLSPTFSACLLLSPFLSSTVSFISLCLLCLLLSPLSPQLSPLLPAVSFVFFFSTLYNFLSPLRLFFSASINLLSPFVSFSLLCLLAISFLAFACLS